MNLSAYREFLDEVHSRNSQFALQLEDLQSTLTDLRLQFEKKWVKSLPRADLVILIRDREDEPLFAHRLILASKSPVFCRMFHSEMLEAETGTLSIDDTTLPVMHAFIRFFYRAEIKFTDEVSAEDVLAVAHKYGVELLQTRCEEHLIETIDEVNLSRLLKLARKFEAKELEATALAFLQEHFEEFADSIQLS